jgi:hypothetical protein
MNSRFATKLKNLDVPILHNDEVDKKIQFGFLVLVETCKNSHFDISKKIFSGHHSSK